MECTAQYVVCLKRARTIGGKLENQGNESVRGRSVDFNGITGGNLICVTLQETEQAG